MFTTRNLRVLVVFSCAITLGVLPALAQEPAPPPQDEVAPAPVPEPAPVVVPPAQALSIASPSRNTEVSFFLGGRVGRELTRVLAGAVSLAESKGFPKLQKLSVGWNEIRDQGALAFAQSQNLPKLKALDIRGNFLADATKQTLRKDLAHLKSLKLY